MRIQYFSFSVVLVGCALADNWLKVESPYTKALLARQEGKDGSFTPGTAPGTGRSCDDAFGVGFTECAASGVCYNPTEGDICCRGGCKRDS